MTYRAAAYVGSIDHFQDLADGFPLHGISRIRCPSKETDMPQVFSLAAVSQISAEADTVKTLWQYMEHEPAQEFLTGNNKEFLSVLVSIIRIVDADICAIDLLDPGVADSCTVGIACKVFHSIAVAIKGLLDKRQPWYGIKLVNKSFPGGRLLQ